jgi:hypothetical protein
MLILGKDHAKLWARYDGVSATKISRGDSQVD